VLLAFQTVMEPRLGARRARWGELRRRHLERRIADLTVVQPDNDMIIACAELRARSSELDHALGDKVHTGDCWIATTAIRLDVRSCPTTACSKVLQVSVSSRPQVRFKPQTSTPALTWASGEFPPIHTPYYCF